MPPHTLQHAPTLGTIARSLLFVALITFVVTQPAVAQREVIDAGICEIQGDGWHSPLKEETVITHGVVTSDLRETSYFGFFVEDPDCDDNPATSNGVWVYQPKGIETPPELTVGSCVVVTGEVNEYFDLTEIVLGPNGVTVEGPCEAPAPTPLDPPQDAAEAAVVLEAHEGMWVSLPPSRVVGATNQYGDSYVVPDASGVKRVFRTALDGRRVGMQTAGWWLDVSHDDLVSGVVGGLTYNYENYKVLMARSADLEIEPGNIERPQSAPPPGAAELSIASHNVENLFDPVNNPDKDDEDSTPTAEQYEKMLGVRACSIVRNLQAPDIIGLQEVENERVLVDLSEAIRELTTDSSDPKLAGATYGGALVEGPDARGIDVAWLFRTDRVRLLSYEQRQTCSTLKQTYNLPGCDMPDGSRGMELYGRPPLLGRFELIATGGRINVIVNHFKSKGGGDEITTPLRTAMARHNLEMVRESKALEPDVPVLVLGDLNDFEDSEPILALTSDGLQEHRWDEVPADERYTFIFNGVSQILDYILFEPGMDAWFSPIHVNTDTGSVHIDDMRGTCAPGEPHERASDHEPLLARLPYAELPVPAPLTEPVYLPAALKSGFFGGEPATVEPTATQTGSGPAPTGAPTQSPPTVEPSEPPPPTDVPTTAPTARSTEPATAQATERATATSTPGLPPSPTAGTGDPPREPLRIDTVFFDGENGSKEPDEYVEFTNVSSGTVDLKDWQVISVRGDQRFTFPDGASIAAGRTCRVYTNEVHEQHCGFSMASGQAIWRNSGDKAEMRDPSGTLIDWFCYGDYEGECG